MSKKISPILFCLIIVSLFSCEKQETVFKNKYLLHCLMIEGESPKIKVCKTLDAFPEYPFDVLYYKPLGYSKDIHSMGEYTVLLENGGAVFNNFEVKKSDVVENDFSVVPKGNNYYEYLTNESIHIKPGEEYDIKVDIFDYFKNEIGETLSAKTIIPKRVELSMLQQPDEAGDNDYDNKHVYHLTFDDPPKNNYYYLLTYELNTGTQNINNIDLDSLWFAKEQFTESYNPDNPSLRIVHPSNGWAVFQDLDTDDLNSTYTLEYNGLLFNDEKFNGKKKEITIKIQKPQDSYDLYNVYLVCELYHVSPEYYYYYYALKKQNESQEDIYSEPVQLYTNIENGLGVFAGASVSRKILKIEPKAE